jgi:hypothetical protein
MAVGQLGFTPEEMQRNVKAFMDALKKDIAQMSDRIGKEIHEVVSPLNLRRSTKYELIQIIGTELDKCTRLHAQWRLQRCKLNSAQGAFGSYVIVRM